MAGEKSDVEVAAPDVARELENRGLDGDHVEELREFVYRAQEWLNIVINEIEFFKNARMAVGDEEDLSLAISKAYELSFISRTEAELLVELLNKHMETHLERFMVSDILEQCSDEPALRSQDSASKRWWQFWR